MIRKVSITALALLSCTAAYAADSRIRTQAYDADAIVRRGLAIPCDTSAMPSSASASYAATSPSSQCSAGTAPP